ncbi:MAG TPA: hypothetical protein PKN32_08580 [Bacteroidales bacterium]|nr:hypothetical protein [Bacteroidales bacterium]
MDYKEKDFSNQYREQVKKFKPWGILIFVDFILIIAGLPFAYFVFNLNSTGIIIYLVFCALLLLVCVPFFINVLKCPNCGKFMGRDVGKYCSQCGVRIRE